MKLKSIQMPKAVEFDESNFSNNYGKFVVQPLERGFGITLGNALRRTLLSSIQGAAIKSVRLNSVQHEFSVMQNIVEDVPEIILNLKQVNLKLHSDEDKAIRVEKDGPSDLKAEDFQVDPEVEILNPSVHIATLGKEAHFEAEIVIGRGRGYVFAEENKVEDDPVGTITVDSLFSPIQKVNYHVENARVGQRTDYDKLTLEIWTNGTIEPDDALAFAAKILKDHLELFINFEEEPEEIEEEPVEERLSRKIGHQSTYEFVALEEGSDSRRQEHNSLGKDYGYNPGYIYLHRKMRALSAIYSSPHDLLGKLDRDSSLTLG